MLTLLSDTSGLNILSAYPRNATKAPRVMAPVTMLGTESQMNARMASIVSVSTAEPYTEESLARRTLALTMSLDRLRNCSLSWRSLAELLTIRMPEATSKALAVRSATDSLICFDDRLMTRFERLTTNTMAMETGTTTCAS